METRYLRLFLDVFRRGSFAAVARDHGMDPSSVSRTIAGLEADLGFGLFDRTTRKLSPTEAGEVYYQRIAPLIEDLERATELAGGSAKSPRGTLRVLAPVSYSLLNVVPLLPSFFEAYPGIKLDLQLTDALLDLVENRIDVAIRLGPLSDTTYVSQELAPMRSYVCASPEFIERHGCPRRPSELAKYPCLLLNMPGFGNRWLYRDAAGAEAHVDVEGRLRTSNAIALKDLALAGAGIILQAEWIVGQELKRGELVDLFPEHEFTASYFTNSIWTLRPSRSHEPAKVRAFIEFLRGALGSPYRRD